MAAVTKKISKKRNIFFILHPKWLQLQYKISKKGISFILLDLDPVYM